MLKSQEKIRLSKQINLAWLWITYIYSAYQGFEQAYLVRLTFGGQVLSSIRTSLQPRLPQKLTLASKVVKIDSTLVISLCQPKSVTHSIAVVLNRRDASRYWDLATISPGLRTIQKLKMYQKKHKNQVFLHIKTSKNILPGLEPEKVENHCSIVSSLSHEL